METLELTATTLEDAAKQAAAKWGVDAASVKLTVLEEAKGLFGKPGKLKVRAERTIEAAAPVEEAPAEVEAPAAEAKPEKAAKAPRTPRGKKAAAPVEEASDAEAAPEEAPAAEAPAAETPASEVIATMEEAEQVAGYLNEMLRLGDIEAEVTIAGLQGKYINLEVDGRDASYLVGRRGEVLNAMQYLSNVIATRQIGSGVRMVLDGNSYRKRREEALYKLAVDIAEQVRERQEEAVLDALPAFERRIVHQALSEFEGISTYSEGEEPNRRVVIAPAE